MASATAPDRRRKVSAQSFGRFGTIIGFLILVVFFSITSPTFLRTDNLLNILTASSLLGIISCGLTIVLVLNDFDLSVGYVATLGGMYAAGFSVSYGIPVGVAAGIGIGLAAGVVNGLIITYLNVSAFIATLGLGIILQGVIFAFTGGAQISQGIPEGFNLLGVGSTLGVRNLVWCLLIVMVLSWIMLTHTPLGRKMYAIGGNPVAARLSGINVRGVRITAFVISGVLAGFAGVLLASNLNAGNPTAGTAYLFDAFTACFVGAATLRDGDFHILGTLVGILLLGVLSNGLVLLGVPPAWQTIAKGTVLILAVAFSGLLRRKAVET
ncbi:MAG: ABC transporter permease [Bifidobacteriaceae bacterium]|nr:ABC transporter permease [Bifidobacteriaceae bacterium]